MKRIFNRTIVLLGMGFIALFSLGATAQEPIDGSAKPQTRLGDTKVEQSKRPVDELVTTARRTEENTLTVPLSISTFSQDQLQAAQIQDMSDVASMTPSLSFQNYFGQDLSVATIRGVSQIDIFGDPNAPIYIDGIYVSSGTGVNFSFLDVARVETLRGPQPAYFGYNAFSGAVNFVSARPSDELTISGEMTVGSDNRRRVAGTVSGPLVSSGKLSGRASVLWDDFDGTYENAADSYLVDQDIGGADYQTFYGSLFFAPNDVFSAQLNLYLSEDHIDPPAMNSVTANCEPELDDPNDPSSANPDRLLNYCGEIPTVGKNDLATIPGQTGETRDVTRTSLNMDWDVGAGVISSLTGYSKTKAEIWASADRGSNGTTFAYQTNIDGFIPGSFELGTFQAPLLQPSAGESKLKDFSQEFRFRSNQNQRIRYMAGIYYRQTEQDSPILAGDGVWAPLSSLPDDMGTDVPFPGGDMPAFCPCVAFGPPGSPGVSAGFGGFIFSPWFSEEIPGKAYDNFNKTKLWSGFGSLAFDFGDQWTGYAEARYTDYEEQFTDGSDDETTNFEDDFTNWRASLEFHPNEMSTGYGSIATGVKQGGLDNVTPTVVGPDNDGIDGKTVTLEYDQEDIITYELGYKSALLDGNLIVQTAVFYSDWTNIVLPQIIEQIGDTQIIPTGVQTNTGDATIKGFELGLTSRFSDRWDGGLGLSYNDSEFTDGDVESFIAFPSFAPDGDMSGQDMLRNPEWQSNINLTFHQNISAAWDWYARGDFLYQSSWWVGLPNEAEVPEHFRTNLRLGFESDNYTIEIWSNNVFDDDTVDAAFRDVYLSNATQEGTNNFSTLFPWRLSASHPERRTFGITLRGRFR